MERKKSTRSKWVTTDKQMTTDSKKRNLSGKKKASHSTEESKEILISEVDKLSLSIQIENCKRKLRRKVQLYKNAENEKITHEHNYKQEVLTKQDAVHHLNCALNNMSAESMFCKNQLEAMEQKYQEMLLEKELFAEEKNRVKNLSNQKAKLELKLSDVDKCSAQIPELCLGLSRIELRSSSLNEELKQNLVQVDHSTSKLIERAKRELLKKSSHLSRIFELNVFTLPPEHQMVLSQEITTSRLIQNAFEFHQQLQFRNSHLDKSIISMENDIFYAARSEQKLLAEVAVAEKVRNIYQEKCNHKLEEYTKIQIIQNKCETLLCKRDQLEKRLSFEEDKIQKLRRLIEDQEKLITMKEIHFTADRTKLEYQTVIRTAVQKIKTELKIQSTEKTDGN